MDIYAKNNTYGWRCVVLCNYLARVRTTRRFRSALDLVLLNMLGGLGWAWLHGLEYRRGEFNETEILVLYLLMNSWHPES